MCVCVCVCRCVCVHAWDRIHSFSSSFLIKAFASATFQSLQGAWMSMLSHTMQLPWVDSASHESTVAASISPHQFSLHSSRYHLF